MSAALKLVDEPFATDAARWAAIERRDPAADGAFWACVATTGIYCLPSCAARPHRKNVSFATSRAEAERLGFRACKRCKPERFVQGPIARRIAEIDWPRVEAALDADGFAALGTLLAREECEALVDGYDDEARYRSTVEMARHGFGLGEYRYFADPLPPIVADLRSGLYGRLAPLASRWAELFGGAAFPEDHAAYRRRCAAQGQSRPTALILKYEAGGCNRLHQDLYGGEVFPVQVAILLAEPGRDFEGGEFVLTEQRPRMQSRAHVVPLRRGEAIAFAVNDRPVKGAKGVWRAKMRHGVATVRSGARAALGIIFHDAE